MVVSAPAAVVVAVLSHVCFWCILSTCCGLDELDDIVVGTWGCFILHKGDCWLPVQGTPMHFFDIQVAVVINMSKNC
jgi:hypothetical protein